MNNSSNTKGFSLIEVLVSLVILSISLLALAGLMTTSTRNNSVGGRLTEAATYAQDKLEELRASEWESIISLQANPGLDNPESRDGVRYNRRWMAREINPNLNEIEVIITWSDLTNHSLTFRTVLSR